MHPLTILFPVLYTLFLWWFTTGAIMAVYGRSRQVVRAYFAAASLLLVLALAGLVTTRQLDSPLGVYLAVTCGVVAWGWQVAGYYLGFVTGADGLRTVERLSRRSTIGERFRLALYVSLYHELAAVGVGVLIALIAWGQPNPWGLWMYVALWLLHTSARLSVFLGVRNFRVDLLPSSMHYLDRLLGRRRNNAFLMWAVIIGTSSTLLLVFLGVLPTTEPAQSAGLLMVATMVALGVLEHLLLVLPLPAVLWGWGIRMLPDAVEPPGRTRADFAFRPVRDED